MRMTSTETHLSFLDARDRELVRQLAKSRGHFTLTDYANYRGISRQGAYGRLQHHFGVLFKRMRPSGANSFPEVYFLIRRIAYFYNPDYQEPKTLHTLLDGLLRTRVVNLGEGEWSHHQRQPSVFVTKTEVHVVDCLDRTPSAVLKFANDLVPENRIVKIHSGRSQRVVATEYLQNRKQSTKEKKDDEGDLTWDSLFGERKRALQNTDKFSNQRPLIEVVYHSIPAFQFGEVC